MRFLYRSFVALALAALPLLASAAALQMMPDQAKKDFTAGGNQVPAAACTAASVPSPCCTGAGAGATCPTYAMALVTSSDSSTATTAVSWGGNNACTGSATPYTCCTGAGAGNCGAARMNTNEASGAGYTAGGATLAGYAITISANHSCVGFTSPVTWSSSTITAQAAVVYNQRTGNVVSVHCLDGTAGTCSANTSSTTGNFTVALPAALFCIN